MKYVTVQSDAAATLLVCEPSKATKAAIQRINSGNYIEQTFRERVEFIHKCKPNHITDFLPSSGERLRPLRRRCKPRTETFRSRSKLVKANKKGAKNDS